MATIIGSLSRSGEIQGPCVWCGRPSTSRAEAPGIGREVPIHLLCCAAVIRAFRLWQERGIDAPADDLRMLSDYAGRVRALGPGE